MSFAAIRVVTNVGKQIVSQSRLSVAKPFLCTRKERQFTRAFARSMWYLSSSSGGGGSGIGSGSGIHFCQAADNLGSQNIRRLNLQHAGQTCSCGNRAGLHTEGDKELSTFLQQEIEVEKGGKQAIAAVPGFTLTQEDALVTLTKTQDGETIKVIFNVNHSVEADPAMGEEGAQGEEDAAPPQMRSYPEFAVEISKKDSTSVLSMKCHFSENEFDEDEDIQPEDLENKDFFLIDEVSIHSGTRTENIYCVGSEVMDGNLYDMLLRMLHERGIDNEFAEKLSDVSSDVEHHHYIGFLEGLKHIVDC